MGHFYESSPTGLELCMWKMLEYGLHYILMYATKNFYHTINFYMTEEKQPDDNMQALN